MNRPALPSFFPKNGSAFPPEMFTAATGVPPERGTGFEAGAWRKGNVQQRDPNGKNPKKKPRITVGNGATGANPLALNLFGAKGGGKRSKTRRLSKKRRVTHRQRRH